MASRLIRNQLPERVAGSTPVSSAQTPSSQAVFFCFLASFPLDFALFALCQFLLRNATTPDSPK